MVTENEPVLIYTTFETAQDAKKVARKLVGERLAACTNILPEMTAVFEWKGELQEAGEAVMIIKTRKGVLKEALQRAKSLHPYETPALIVLDPMDVDRDFAEWIAGQTSEQKTAPPEASAARSREHRK